MKVIYKQIEDYLTYCQKVRKMSPTTLRAKRYILTRFADETGLKTLKKMTNQLLDLYTAKLSSNGASGRSINTYSAAIVAFAKYYSELGLATSFKPVLVHKMKERKVERKFYATDEINRVVKTATPEIALITMIMFETGMRISEITYLRLSDIRGQRINFIGKGSKLREVYITRSTRELLDQYILARKPREYLWGMAINDEPPTASTVRRKLQRAFAQAGLNGFYPHALRHSFATNLQLKGASVAEIKEMMGHNNIATTERYLHGFDDKMRELFEKYS